jgi:biopolymer transport protein TolQ
MAGGLNIWEILWQSGPVVKLVLLILVLCSVVSWAIIFHKIKEIKTIEKANLEFLKIFATQKNMAELFHNAISQRDSTIGLMYRRGYEEINRLNEKISDKKQLGQYLKEQQFLPVERALKNGAAQAQERLETRVPTLATIGSVTPFIGLFGTVWGIIGAFSGLSQGGGSIEAVAPGIAEALVATAVGLAAAIPAVWSFNSFTTKLSKMQTQLESFGQDFLNLLERTLILNSKE